MTDNNKDGSFVNSDITYGNGTGQAFITPLLFTSDFGNTKPAAQQVVGAGIDYAYSFTCSGISVVELNYTFTNMRKPGDLFPDVNGLRFMLDATAFGSAALTTTDKASQNWPTASLGDPDKRQIQDLNQGALNTILVSNNAVTDSANNCAPAGCTTDFGLEWDLKKLTPGESWTIRVSLVDNPSLVTGGRYLRADSVDVVGNSLGRVNTRVYYMDMYMAYCADGNHRSAVPPDRALLAQATGQRKPYESARNQCDLVRG